MTIPLAVITTACYAMSTMPVMNVTTIMWSAVSMTMTSTCYAHYVVHVTTAMTSAMSTNCSAMTFQDVRSSKINVKQPPYSKNNNQTQNTNNGRFHLYITTIFFTVVIPGHIDASCKSWTQGSCPRLFRHKL